MRFGVGLGAPSAARLGGLRFERVRRGGGPLTGVQKVGALPGFCWSSGVSWAGGFEGEETFDAADGEDFAHFGLGVA